MSEGASTQPQQHQGCRFQHKAMMSLAVMLPFIFASPWSILLFSGRNMAEGLIEYGLTGRRQIVPIEIQFEDLIFALADTG